MLFTKYQRLPGETARRIHGTGLGLFIVKQTVEAHGGSVWAESEGIPGEGSTFVVKLPLALAAQMAS
ncbi:MAG: ATP-binding protein [Anaerolineae bacterium]|nr:ATP-binding protein [Anaerolineae bacterium]